MNTSDLAILPHQSRSASTAITSPKAVASDGTMISHIRLLKTERWKLPSPNAHR